MTHSTLVAAAVSARDAPPDRIVLTLAALARAIERLGGSIVERRPDRATLAFEDQLDAPRMLDALAREARARQDVDLRVGAHLGVRVRTASPRSIGLGTRCMQQVQALTTAAERSETLVSEELATMMGLSNAGRAPSFLAPVERYADPLGAVRAWRFDPNLDPLVAPTWQPEGTLPASVEARNRLGARLGALLTGDLGPVAPLLLPKLARGAMLAEEIVKGVQRYLPPQHHERVRELIEREVQAVAE